MLIQNGKYQMSNSTWLSLVLRYPDKNRLHVKLDKWKLSLFEVIPGTWEWVGTAALQAACAGSHLPPWCAAASAWARSRSSTWCRQSGTSSPWSPATRQSWMLKNYFRAFLDDEAMFECLWLFLQRQLCTQGLTFLGFLLALLCSCHPSLAAWVWTCCIDSQSSCWLPAR